MATIRVNEAELFYEDSGHGEETIVFSHGCLMTHEMYRAQIDALKDRYRCIAYDHRGHGKSRALNDQYSMEDIYHDGEALIAALDCGPCHFVGMSTGGFVGLRLGFRRSDLLKSLILIDTSTEGEGGKRLREYNVMLFVLRTLGYGPVLFRAFAKLFGAKFLNDPARRDEVELWKEIVQKHDRHAIYKFGKGIFYRDVVVAQLAQITTPTVVLIGENDIATPIQYSEQIVAAIPDATLHKIPNSGHTSPVEAPTAVFEIMEDFLANLE